MNRFRGVWRAPHARQLILASVLARLPYSINALSIVLFVHDLTGSFAQAGLVSAAYALAAAVGQPAMARLVDRLGQTQVMLVTTAVGAAGLVALIALGLAGAPTGVLAVAAVVAGGFQPPVSPAFRGLLPDLLRDEDLMRSALALDAILLEVVFIGGPVLAAALIAVGSPALALCVSTAAMVVGSLWFAATPPSRSWRGGERAAGWLGPLRSPGLRTLLLASGLLGIPLGTLDVALPAFGVEQGSRGLGGVFIAAMAVGSLIGGVWYGARAHGSAVRAYLVLSVVLPFGFAAVLLADSTLTMLLLAPLAGATLAPLTAAENELAGEIAPAGTVTEAYAWLITGVVVGLSIGTAIAGVLVDESGWRSAVAFGAVSGLLGALLGLARRKTLEPLAASTA